MGVRHIETIGKEWRKQGCEFSFRPEIASDEAKPTVGLVRPDCLRTKKKIPPGFLGQGGRWDMHDAQGGLGFVAANHGGGAV